MSVPPQRILDLLDAQMRNNPRRVVRAIDYLLVTTYDHGDRTPAGWDSSGAAELARGVSIERIEAELAERLLRATELRGEHWEPRRQDHVVHAYSRIAWHEDSDDEVVQIYNWDAEGRIYPCVQLSRLIRDNGTSTEHAVRRLIHADGTELLVPFDGFDSHVAYRLYPERNGWLDIHEARQLADLMRAYWRAPEFPRRVGQALRRADLVTRVRYLQDALPLVVAGLESLLNVGRDFAAAQFAQRGSALAAEAGVSMTPAEARALYDGRSTFVHGGDVDLSLPHERNSFELGFIALQETLRWSVRRAIENAEFGAVFSADPAISERWPAVVTRRGRRHTI